MTSAVIAMLIHAKGNTAHANLFHNQVAISLDIFVYFLLTLCSNIEMSVED